MARRVRKDAPDIPIFNYAPPTVWAWRPWRARAMRAYVDEVLAILPFEPAAFARLEGPPCTYVGHPLAERIDALRPNAEEARRRTSDPPILLVLPGSRASEIRRLAGIFGDAIAQLAQAGGTARCGAADAPAYRRTGDRGGRQLAGSPPHRCRGGGETRRIPHRAGGACRIRHRDARARAGAGSDRRRLPHSRLGGRRVPPDGAHRHRDPRQSGARREGRARISARRVHAGPARARPCAAARRHTGTASAARGLRASGRDHGPCRRASEQARRTRDSGRNRSAKPPYHRPPASC